MRVERGVDAMSGNMSQDTAPLLEMRNVEKRFGDVVALRDVSFGVNAGDVVALLGRSGSGKSTLLRCLALLDATSAGEVLLEGRRTGPSETAAKALARDRARIGVIFQNFNLFPHLSVEHNLCIGPRRVLGLTKEQARDRALRLLESVGLRDKAHNYPVQLSGGQQQRVGIARALAMEPAFLMFDEPTSALDPETISDVLTVMADLAAGGTTMFVATHEIGFAREVANRVLFMHQGQIHYDGAPTSFFEHEDDPLIVGLLSRLRHEAVRKDG